MKRRDFLRYGSTFSLSTPFLWNQNLVRTFSAPQFLNCEEVSDRIMVVIQLDGGNDGLNTLVPIAQYDTYANLRPNLAIPQNSYLEL
ncbi:MAG: hypothetical protein AAGD05_13820, partial [Bacteroidota bacterium]